MTVRSRIVVLAGIAVAVGVAVAGALLTTIEIGELRDQVDADLGNRAGLVATELLTTGDPDQVLRLSSGVEVAYAQVVDEHGEITPLTPAAPRLPVDEATAVAAGDRGRFFATVEVGGVGTRVLTVPLRPGAALQLGRPVGDLDLHVVRITGTMVAITVAGIGLALLLGRTVAHVALRPVARLTAAAERIAETGDLGRPVDVGDDPELARLAGALNVMRAALDESLAAQRRLVADASHQLQTPLTSLRTNIEVLDRSPDMSAEDRRRLVGDLVEQLDDLSLLVTNLIDLSRDRSDQASVTDVEMERAVEDAIRWAVRSHSDVVFAVDLQPATVEADADAVDRMLRNLLDNAATWSPDGGTVEVTMRSGRIEVRDHGPGFLPADLPRVFERFYRSDAAGDRPGAGLGLAIVRKVVDEHGWSVVAANHAEGGGVVTVSIPADSWRIHSDRSVSAQDGVLS